MKRSELFFSAIQVPADFAMIILAAITAFAIRDVPQILALKPKLYNFSFEDYIIIVLIITPLFLVIYAIEGLYDIRATRKFWQETLKVFTATSISLVIIIVAIFLKREWFSSRFIILAGWIIAVSYVVMMRYLLQSIQKWLLVKKEVGVHRVLLIGGNRKLYQIKMTISKKPQLGYKVIGQIGFIDLKRIKDIRKKKGIDEMILCDPSVTDAQQEKLIDYCSINNITYRYIPTTLQTSRFEIRMLNGEPLLEIQHTPLDGWWKIIKRV
ncbi:nucleoside-diphosphate sugar epimerase/dehydratase, partial [Patescibacteria group bacterium]